MSKSIAYKYKLKGLQESFIWSLRSSNSSTASRSAGRLLFGHGARPRLVTQLAARGFSCTVARGKLWICLKGRVPLPNESVKTLQYYIVTFKRPQMGKEHK